MPLYNYRCSDCGLEWENLHKVARRRREFCKTCGKKAEIMPGNVQKYVPFHEGTYEHIAPDPIHVTSKRQLKELEKIHRVEVPYAHDGG